MSTRGFERLYVRWTDALAVYDTSNDLMDPAAMRVARLVETGILMRRLLRETAFETEVAMKGERPWIPPWFSRGRARGERLRQIVAEAGLTTSIAPPTHSVEGEHLLADVLAAFDVPRLSEQCGLTLAELDRRFEWARARWLILITLLLFVMNMAIALHG